MRLPGPGLAGVQAVGLCLAASRLSSAGLSTHPGCSGLSPAVSEFPFADDRDEKIDGRPVMRVDVTLLLDRRPAPVHEADVMYDILVFRFREMPGVIVPKSFTSSDREESVGSLSVVSSLKLALKPVKTLF
jgi:hypothetical protein